MSKFNFSFRRETWARWVFLVRAQATDPEVGRRVMFFFFTLVIFALVITGLHVINSYVSLAFVNAIVQRDRAGFPFQALLLTAVLSAIAVLSVISRYAEERLGLLSRKWLTWRIFRRYADNRVYFRLAKADEIGNPDQLIAEDIRSFTVSTLSFFLMLLNSVLIIFAFSGVLWTISPQLFAIAVLYASGGTYLAYRLGRPLMRLNYVHADMEADFRASLFPLKDKAEGVALARFENQLIRRARRRLDDLTKDFLRIVLINRNVGFLVTGYNSLITIIPALIVAPLVIDGKGELGIVVQSTIAFSELLAAFSIIVTQFQSLSSFAAVITRVAVLNETALREGTAEVAESESTTEGWQTKSRLAYRNLTLRSPRSGQNLVEKLDVEIPAGRRVLVYGPDETALDALFRATAGIWPTVEGRVIRPPLDKILFVTERPYLCPGTLRELFLPLGAEYLGALEEFRAEGHETLIRDALAAVDLENVLVRFDGLDTEQDWDDILSPGEKQLLALARVLVVKPSFVVLRNLHASDYIVLALRALSQNAITYLSIETRDDLRDYYDAILELRRGGSWQFRS